MRIAHSAARLLNKEITIIANNCTAGFIYKDMRLRFNSPTIGLFFYAPDYLQFLQRFDEYLEMELDYERDSMCGETAPYPIGRLGEIEIHFQHYKDWRHARAKWNERKTRIQRDKLFIIGSEVKGCTPQIMREFDVLPFRNKIFLTQSPYPQLQSAVHMKKYEHEKDFDYMRRRDWVEYADLVKWFNGEADYRIGRAAV